MFSATIALARRSCEQVTKSKMKTVFQNVSGVKTMVLLVFLTSFLCRTVGGDVPPGYSSVEDLVKDLKALTKENKGYRDTNRELNEQISTMSEKLADLRAAGAVEEEMADSTSQTPVPFWLKWWNYHHEPPSKESAEAEEGCNSFRCCLLMVVDSVFDVVWIAISDPIGFIGVISTVITDLVQNQVRVLSAILGGILTFSVINVVLYATTKITDMCNKIHKMVKAFLKLPLMSLIIETIKKAYKWVLNIMDVEKQEKEMDEKLAKLSEAMEKIKQCLDKPIPSAETQDLGAPSKRCGYCGAWGHVHTECERKRAEDIKCSYCGRTGHVEMGCRLKKEHQRFGYEKKGKDVKKPKASHVLAPVEKGGDQKPPMPVECRYCHGVNHVETYCLKKRAAEARLLTAQEKGKKEEVEEIPVTKLEAAPSVSVVGDDDQNNDDKRLVYVPIRFRDVKINRCLIDTGAQVNLMPASIVTRHGFPLTKDGIQTVYGFDGTPGRIQGLVEGRLSFGDDSQTLLTDFMVSPDITTPIIGFPALRDSNLWINCQNHEIYNKRTGKTILCSVVTTEKN